MLGVPIMSVAVFTEGENDCIDSHVVHLHVKVTS